VLDGAIGAVELCEERLRRQLDNTVTTAARARPFFAIRAQMVACRDI
jgi:hypothetical protein